MFELVRGQVALGDDEPDAEVLAEMALTPMRPKMWALRKAMVGHFKTTGPRCSLHLDRVDQLSATPERLDAEVDRLMAPFAEAATRLLSIPRVAERSAEVIVAEIGLDMSRFASVAGRDRSKTTTVNVDSELPRRHWPPVTR